MSALERFRWFVQVVIMGRIKLKWQNVNFVLSCFHQKKSFARQAYRAFVEKGIAFDTFRMRGVDIAERLNLSAAAISKQSVKGRNDQLGNEIGRLIFR